MSVEQLTEQHLEFVSLTGGYTLLCQGHIVGNHMSRLVLLIVHFLLGTFADPESFVSGGPTLTTFLFYF